MHYKFVAAAVVAGSLLAAPVAFAQTSPPPDNTGPSGAGVNAPTAMHHHKMRHHAHMMRHGTTTGMSTRPSKPTTRKPPSS